MKFWRRCGAGRYAGKYPKLHIPQFTRRGMSQKLDRLKEIMAEVADLNTAASLLSWDQQTYMPEGGAPARGQQMATLGKLAHEKATSDEVGRLLEDLKAEFAGADLNTDDAAL